MLFSRSVMSNSLRPLPGFSVHGILQTKEYWSGKPLPSSGDLPNPEIEPGSPALQAYSLPSEPSWHHLLLLLGCYVQLFVTPQIAAHQASLSSTICKTHVPWFGDAIQPSHSLSPPSPPALNLSHRQDLFQ